MVTPKNASTKDRYTEEELAEIRNLFSGSELPSFHPTAFSALRLDGVIMASKPRLQIFPSADQMAEPCRILQDSVDANCRHFYREGLMQVPPGFNIVPVNNGKVWTPNGPVDRQE
ncbi:hypothetical protein BV898_04351 [Hypsibius exemplaris]|uniref:Uncharacterized protein n=1 Tax=Hypsibius exemplaris TaxID=2072580 RepID=A0A1W0X2T4_HYPEX|nr:hypothetical protein BV898_04351 [Hypsibius exemplaris]